MGLGLKDAFDPDRADLSGMAECPDGLFLSEVVHRARVSMDENGTQAAAASLIACGLGAPEEEPPEPIPFVVDRPFLFLIRDPESGAILFMGRVLNPVA